MLEIFKRRIADKRAKVGVIGLGYVGLPLAMAFAKEGFTVTGIDVDKKKLSSLKRCRSYVVDVPALEIREATRKGRFKATGDYQALGSLDAVVICVPTPLSKTKEPDVSFVVDAARRVAGHLKKGQLVVLESTTYPGTTQELVLPILEKSGLKAEKDFFLAFSPERVDPGNKVYDTVSIPKVVGGVGPLSLGAVKSLYGAVVRELVPVSSAKTAEMVKLLENTFRSVNIGFINEMGLVCQRLGIDIWEVIEAAKTKPFGFMAFYPGPGLGGHCLPIDPLYLSWKSRLQGFDARMIELAASINERMPLHVVERVTGLLEKRRVPVRRSKVLVLGVSYKKDIDDVRESPAFDVIQHLLKDGVEVKYSDPWVKRVEIGGVKLFSKPLTKALLQRQDCVVILTDHGTFPYPWVVKYAKAVLDTRNVLRKYHPRKNLFFL